MYLDGVIHVLPNYVPPVVEKKPKKEVKQVVKKVVVPDPEIRMTDFIQDKATGLLHETYYHRVYHKNE